MKEIKNIQVEHIHPHPDNPRKDLGDVSELAESIKKNGIMQNLTVIPKDDEYTVIIGHRRLEAAIQAGIDMVPCRVIYDMPMKEQITTMLEENMQRSDLTIYEQAQGFQMMLDLGETIESITEKTGFSKTTIYHRINIAKLNQKILLKKEADDSIQLSIKDLAALEQVKSISTRNKILKDVKSSREIEWRAKRAAQEEEYEAKAKIIIKMLEERGVKAAPEKAKNERWSGNWQEVGVFLLDKKVPKRISLKKTDEQLFYIKYDYTSSISVIVRAKKIKHKLTQKELELKKREVNKKKILQISKQLKSEMHEFVTEIINKDILVQPSDTLEALSKAWETLMKIGNSVSINSAAYSLLDKDSWKFTDEEKKECVSKVEKASAISQMLVFIVSGIRNTDVVSYTGFFNEEAAKEIKCCYELLNRYGFTFECNETESILNGTHEFYRQQDGD